MLTSFSPRPVKFVITLLIIFPFCFYACTVTSSSFENIETDVLIIGGGASGTAAAIQSARRGVQTILVEPTPWLGGMLTAAGVSATDGNHRLPSGLWGEFRDSLYDHYGGPDSVSTGWVSNTHFEPHVGHSIWENMADAEAALTRRHGFHLAGVLLDKNSKVTGAEFVNEAGKKLTIRAKITIDATELGDVLSLAGVEFFTGQDTPDMPHDPNIQDLTFTAIIQDFSPGKAPPVVRPADYDASEFDCICKEVCPDSSREVPDCNTYLSYARLPNNKYLLNWPNNGNDYFVNPIPMNANERKEAYQAAKMRTLSLLYFMQTEMGYEHLGLATDEFPTEDLLPFIPYHREARRIQGLEQVRVEDLIDPYANSSRPLYKQAIAVGDYPLDHHHGKNPSAKPETFPSIPSFSVPYHALVPAHVDGLLVAEKSISVSHVVNGATRLQPCVILIGQAAGMAAALSVELKQSAREIPIKSLQKLLLESDCWLMPFIDVSPSNDYFEAVQRMGVSGYMRGVGVPYKWANQTWFYPEKVVDEQMMEEVLARIPESEMPKVKLILQGTRETIKTRADLAIILDAALN